MDNIFEWTSNNTALISAVTAVIGLIAGGAWTLFKRIQNQSDLRIPDLNNPDSKRLTGLDGYPVLIDTKNGRQVFTEGFKVELTFSHNGKGNEAITVRRIELCVNQFISGVNPSYAYKGEGDAIIGAGISKVHEFNAIVSGNQVLPVTWIIDAKIRHFEQAKSRNFLDADAIDKQEGQKLTFTKDEKSETLAGTVLLQETGWYEVQFEYYYTIGNKDKKTKSHIILAYKN